MDAIFAKRSTSDLAVELSRPWNFELRLFLIVAGRCMHESFELFVKVRQIIETAFETNLPNIEIALHEKFACVRDSQFGEVLNVGLPRSCFEVSAKGSRRMISERCYFFKRNVLAEMVDCVMIHFVDALR